MSCPNCQKKVQEGTSICPHCDHILDDSFLGEDGGSSPAAEGTVITAVPKAARASGARRQAPREEAELRAAGRDSAGKDDLIADAHNPAAALNDLVVELRALAKEDKLIIGSALLAFLSVFFPWKTTTDQMEELGLAGTGVLVMLLAATSALFAYLRTKKKLADVPPSWLSAAGAIAAGLGVLAAALFIASARGAAPAQLGLGKLGASEIPTPSASLGAYLGALGCLGGLVGSILRARAIR